MVSLFHKLLHQTWDAYKPATSNYHKNSTLLNSQKSSAHLMEEEHTWSGAKNPTSYPPPGPGHYYLSVNFCNSLPEVLADSSLHPEILWFIMNIYLVFVSISLSPFVLKLLECLQQ